jgi:hypothetical protein
LEGAEHWFAILLFAMAEENIRVVAAENPVSLIALAQRLDRDSDRLLDAMELGRPGFPPNPSRARQLRDIRHASGTLTPRAVWPNLENILTWQGGAAGFHLPHVSALWGDTTMRCPGLRAAEGMFSIPLRDNDASGVLAVGGHVMEFLPCADAAPETIAPHAPTLLAGQLEEGRLYRLIATTSGGFYRYDTGDLLRVTGFRGRTPEVRFERRAGAGLSAAGEELTEDQVVSAMGVAAANGPLLNGFTLTYETLPEVGTRSVLALECTGGSELSGGRGKRLRGRLEQLLSVLDFELMQRNIGYNAKRQDGTLAFPRAVLLAEGSYARLRAGLADSGRPECQIKQPVLAQPPFFDAMPIAAEL